MVTSSAFRVDAGAESTSHHHHHHHHRHTTRARAWRNTTAGLRARPPRATSAAASARREGASSPLVSRVREEGGEGVMVCWSRCHRLGDRFSHTPPRARTAGRCQRPYCSQLLLGPGLINVYPTDGQTGFVDASRFCLHMLLVFFGACIACLRLRLGPFTGPYSFSPSVVIFLFLVVFFLAVGRICCAPTVSAQFT